MIDAIASQDLTEPFKLKPRMLKDGGMDQFTGVLESLISKTGMEGSDVGIAIDEEMVIIKTVTTALGLDESDTKDQLNWEADGYLVAPLSDYILQYEKLPIKTKEGNSIYLLVCIRKKVLHILQSLMNRVNLRLKNMDVNVFTQIRSLVANYKIEEKGISAIIDIQKRYVKIAFIQQNDYYLSHQVDFHDEKYDEDSITADNIVERLIKELKRLIFGHSLGRQIDDLNGLYVIGNDAVHQIANALTAQVSIPVEIINPFRQLKVSESVAREEEFEHFPERFGACVGVALKNIPTLVKS